MAGSDGGAYTFGTNSYDGSMGGQTLNAPVVGVADSYNEEGYWLVGSDGGVYSSEAPSFTAHGRANPEWPCCWHCFHAVWERILAGRL